MNLSHAVALAIGIVAIGGVASTFREPAADAQPQAIMQGATLTTDADGMATWTYPHPYAVAPIVQCTPVGGATDAFSCQLQGPPTNTGAAFRVTRTLGLTASVGATTLHVTAQAPTP